jgi:ubiquinone/menaquinone biosynthesis C-methylase UbiE
MRFLEPQGDAIVAGLEVEGGFRVLDIASGTGDPGLTLAARRPEVHVTALDASEGMLDIAQEKAGALGLTNFETKLGDACALDLESQSFDAISCRLGFMFFPDPAVAVREMGRVLRPGGTLATTVWAGPSENSWITTMVGAIKKHFALPTPPPGAPGMFRCADPATLTEKFEEAGLRIERVELLRGTMKCSTSDEYWQFMNDVVPPVVAALADAAESVTSAIREEVFSALLQEGSSAPRELSWGAHCIVASK